MKIFLRQSKIKNVSNGEKIKNSLFCKSKKFANSKFYLLIFTFFHNLFL